MTKQGTVGYVSPGKPYRGKTLYSFKLVNDETWYGMGEEQPQFSEGDMVRFEHDAKNGVDTTSLKTKKGEAPVAAPKPAGKSWGGGKKDAGREEYWAKKEESDAERQKAINYQSARKDAIEVMKLMVDKEMVKLPTKASDKFDGVLALIQEVTVRYYNETQNLTGTSATTSEEDEVPEGAESADEDFNDDIEWDNE